VGLSFFFTGSFTNTERPASLIGEEVRVSLPEWQQHTRKRRQIFCPQAEYEPSVCWSIQAHYALHSAAPTLRAIALRKQ